MENSAVMRGDNTQSNIAGETNNIENYSSSVDEKELSENMVSNTGNNKLYSESLETVFDLQR